MGDFVHKENSGSLFKNDKKQKETSPDYRGEANVNGVTIEISGWKKQGKKGDYLSLSFRAKVKSENKPAPDKVWVDEASDIPF